MSDLNPKDCDNPQLAETALSCMVALSPHDALTVIGYVPSLAMLCAELSLKIEAFDPGKLRRQKPN